MEKTEDSSSRGIIELDPNESGRITKLIEKPDSDKLTQSRLASVVFYCLRKDTLPRVDEYLSSQSHFRLEENSFGRFVDWLIQNGTPIYGMKIPTRFQLIGHVGLSDYQKWTQYFQARDQDIKNKVPINCRAYARVGLMGNPSDGFNGKTISLSIKNFWAEATIFESPRLNLIPHPLNDPTVFGSLADLHCISKKEGYMGGLRLVQATCKKFYEYCDANGIALPRFSGFY